MIKKEKVETFTSKCDCRGELLSIEVQKSYDNEAEISIYSLFGKMSFLQKIRYIWRVLTIGTPYGDQMILSSDEMKRLKEFLIKTYNE